MPSTRLYNFKVNFANKSEYHSLKREIFTQHIYQPQLDISEADTPIIVDAGAHIGLATFYFKWLYPQVQIIAIEADPTNYKLLKQNVFENNLNDVYTHNFALADKNGNAEFFVNETGDWHSTGSLLSGAWTGTEKTQAITVPCHTLDFVIDQFLSNSPTHQLSHSPILLKADIEGAESKVLLVTGKKLQIFDEIMIEFHPRDKQSLSKLIEFLEKLDFKVKLEKKNKQLKNPYFGGLLMIRALKKQSRKIVKNS